MELIVKRDFPERFEPTKQICDIFKNSDNTAELYTAMVILKQIVKKF